MSSSQMIAWEIEADWGYVTCLRKQVIADRTKSLDAFFISQTCPGKATCVLEAAW